MSKRSYPFLDDSRQFDYDYENVFSQLRRATNFKTEEIAIVKAFCSGEELLVWIRKEFQGELRFRFLHILV